MKMQGNAQLALDKKHDMRGESRDTAYVYFPTKGLNTEKGIK